MLITMIIQYVRYEEIPLTCNFAINSTTPSHKHQTINSGVKKVLNAFPNTTHVTVQYVRNKHRLTFLRLGVQMRDFFSTSKFTPRSLPLRFTMMVIVIIICDYYYYLRLLFDLRFACTDESAAFEVLRSQRLAADIGVRVGEEAPGGPPPGIFSSPPSGYGGGGGSVTTS